MTSIRWLCALLVELYSACVTMTIKFDFGAGFDGEQFNVWDSNTVTSALPVDFLFLGSSYSTVLVSDNGAISFTASADTLNNMKFTSAEQWIAPLGYDAYSGTVIWVNHHQGSSTNGQLATQIVRDFNGNDNYAGDSLSVVTWENLKDGTNEVNTVQVALSQNSAPDESYIIFMYDKIQTNSASVKVGLSFGDGSTIALAWNGSNTALGCDEIVTSSIRNFTVRSQTPCNTRAGVLVFAVKTLSSFIKGNMCLYVPNSDCSITTTKAPTRPRRCRLRRKRNDINEL